MLNVYGIKNCDTMKKTFTWLESHSIAYEFHDYKKVGADKVKLKQWAGQVDWQKIINTKGQSFRKLPPEKQADLTEQKAYDLMLENPSMIKRPIIEAGKKVLLGFNPEELETLLEPLLKP